ncbi:MAG: PAS domain S-box protein [Halorientalis sp.]
MSEAEPIRVLHVDDDPEIVELAATFLEREESRLDMVAAVTGEEALAELGGGTIDAVVSDYQLPDMDPAEFVGEIHDVAPDVPVILFTGRDRAQLDGDLLEGEYAGYLQKGSGTEQYGELAAEIVTLVDGEAVTDGGRPMTDGGTATGRDLSAVAGGSTEVVLRALLDAVDDPLLVLDDGGRAVYWNRGLAEATGYDDARLAGVDPRELVADGDGEAVATALATAREEGRADARATLETAEGATVPVEVHCARLTDTSGNVVALACTFHDVSESEAQRAELERQHERLEEVIGATSHDLRNPLNVITGRLQLARETGDEEHFEALDRATRRLETLITDLVDLTRKGHTVTEPQAVDLAEAAGLAWEELDAGDATLSVEYEGTVEADLERVEQLLRELFANAVQHNEGPVTVTLGELPDGFYVADDGEGMPGDSVERLVEYGETTDGDATGLGLALARRIVQAHGWSLSITESESGGTRVEVHDVGSDPPPAP